MARIAGVTLPKDKRTVIGLTYIFGVGKTTSQKVLKEANIDESIRIKDLTEDQVNAIRSIIEKTIRVEGELRRDVNSNIKRMKDIKAYRGIRHAKRLPVRGQRTKTNSRTQRGGGRNTMGSGRRTVAKK